VSSRCLSNAETGIYLDGFSYLFLLVFLSLFLRFLIAATADVNMVPVVVNCRKIMTGNFFCFVHWKVSIIEKRKSLCVNFSTLALERKKKSRESWYNVPL